MSLFIFDFDHTIIDGHSHNWLIQNKRLFTADDIESQWNLIRHMKPIGTADAWLNTFRQLRESGHQIGIASFGKYGPNIIPRFLKETLGLPQEWVDDICIRSWLPENAETADKSKHIKEIIEEKKYKGEAATVVLIDDSSSILLKAYESGHSIVEATPDGNHLRYIQSLSSVIKAYEEPVSKDKKAPIKYHEPLVYGNTLPQTINDMKYGRLEQDDGKESAGNARDIRIIPADMLTSSIKKYHLANCMIITPTFDLYFVENNQQYEKYPVDRNALKACLNRHNLMDQLIYAADKPGSAIRHLSDQALEDINRIIMNGLSLPSEPPATLPSTQSSSSFFSSAPDDREDALPDDREDISPIISTGIEKIDKKK